MRFESVFLACLLPAVAYSSKLGSYAVQKVLYDATPIFGPYSTVNNAVNKTRATWMKPYPDSLPIVHMNLPGTHDTATWNYSDETRERLLPIDSLVHDPEFPSSFYRCQDKSIFDMLNDGIRVFDLRTAFDLTNTTLVFWHSQALQSQTASLEDVLFGFYKWLDDHPSEAVFISLNYEGNTIPLASNNAAVQLELFRTLTTPAARHYFVQAKNKFGTLGQARGKITFLRRFELDQLSANYTEALPGVAFSPSKWKDNNPEPFPLEYNTDKHLVAYMEDYYQPSVPDGDGFDQIVQIKVNATEANFRAAANATGAAKDSLFWSFASSTEVLKGLTPFNMALGLVDNEIQEGVNNKLVPFFQSMKGKRLGICMFDFYEYPTDLLGAFLDIQTPGSCH